MTYTIKVVLSSNPIKEWAKNQATDAIIGTFEAIGNVLMDLSYSIALIGGGVSILLWLSGWDKGKKWAGILFMAHVLVRFLLGGVI